MQDWGGPIPKSSAPSVPARERPYVKRVDNGLVTANLELRRISAKRLEPGVVSTLIKEPYLDMAASLAHHVGDPIERSERIGVARVLSDDELRDMLVEGSDLFFSVAGRTKFNWAGKVLVAGAKEEPEAEGVDINRVPFGCDPVGIRGVVSLLAQNSFSALGDLADCVIVPTEPDEFAVSSDGGYPAVRVSGHDVSVEVIEPGPAQETILRPYGFLLVSHNGLNDKEDFSNPEFF